MEKTKWEGTADYCPLSVPEKFQQEHHDIWLQRRILRFVGIQYKKFQEKEGCSDSIFYLDDDGITRIKETKNLSEEEREELLRLIRLNEDGILFRHQLTDLERPTLSQRNYNKWYNDELMNSYMYTIPTKDVFHASEYNINGYTGGISKLVGNHNLGLCSEINDSNEFYGYSIWTTLVALNRMNPILIFYLIGKNVQLSKDEKFVICDYEFNGRSKKLAAYINSGELFYINSKGEYKIISDNLHDLIFKHYREPVYKIINSVNSAIDPYFVPGEGLFDLDIDTNISDLTSEILNSSTYEKAKQRIYASYVFR